MDIIEFLLFIPLLIYGIALSQLLGQWKRFFDIENFHGPFVVTVIAFTEVAVSNIYSFLEIFTARDDHSYLSYLLDLSGPFLLLLAVNALVKDDNHDGIVDRDEFHGRMRLTYGFMAAFVAHHLIPGFRADDGILWLRLPAIVVMLAIAITRKEWIVYVLGLIWLVGFILHLMSVI